MGVYRSVGEVDQSITSADDLVGEFITAAVGDGDAELAIGGRAARS